MVGGGRPRFGVAPTCCDATRQVALNPAKDSAANVEGKTELSKGWDRQLKGGLKGGIYWSEVLGDANSLLLVGSTLAHATTLRLRRSGGSKRTIDIQ
jgi:hypothetical protein